MVRQIADDIPEQKVIDDVARYGWHCMNVLAEDASPGFSFTIGHFHSNGRPEFIIVGLRPEVAHKVLGLAVDAMQSGAIVDLSLPTDKLLNGYPCVFVQVPESEYHEYVGFCRWYYEGNAFPLYQIVWPSKHGQFPWHPEASAAFRATQPVIGHAGGGANPGDH